MPAIKLDNKVVVSGADATANVGAEIQAGVSGKGTFEARNGATVIVGTALSAGSRPAGNGTIVIDGPGTTLTSSTMYLGNGNAGPLATGTMTVSDQAVVTFTGATNGVVTLGDDDFSEGTLTVTGAGTLVQSTGGTAEWWVGGSSNDAGGTGTLNVLDHAHVTTTGRIVLGYGSAAVGNVTVDGGSQLDVNGDYLLVGLNGHGFTDVTGGGTLNVNRMFVADAAGSAGSELDVSGPGSVVNVDRLLHVGDTNRGTVVVSAGGRLNVAVGVPTERLIIGDQGAADGSKLTVSGPNSRVDYHGTADVAVGNAGGANTANVADRATLEVTSGGVFSAVQRNPDTQHRVPSPNHRRRRHRRQRPHRRGWRWLTGRGQRHLRRRWRQLLLRNSRRLRRRQRENHRGTGSRFVWQRRRYGEHRRTDLHAHRRHLLVARGRHLWRCYQRRQRHA